MRVIKLGGSLLQTRQLLACLQRIEQSYLTDTVIVTGGGAFADQVRLAQQHWQFNDNAAHQMAVLAMQQTALLVHALKPDFARATAVSHIKALLTEQANRPVIWSPAIEALNQAGIEASWDITSDSLAAWLAGQLTANECLLIKSAQWASPANFAQLSKLGIVDAAFEQFVSAGSFEVSVINYRDF